MSFRLKGLREKRGELKAKGEAFVARMQAAMEKENRAMNPDERAEFDRIRAELVTVSDEITQAEQDLGGLADLIFGGNDGEGDGEGRSTIPGKGNSGLDKLQRAQQRHDPDRERADFHTRALGFQGWVRAASGMDLTEDHYRAMKRIGVSPNQKEFGFKLRGADHYRALNKGTGSAGGYTVPQGFSDALEKALQDFSHVRGVTESVRTDHGRDLPWPTVDDTSESGAMLSEGEEVAYSDTLFSSVTLGAYKFTSKMFVVGYELLQDASEAVQLERVLGELLGERIGRAQGPYLTTGTGTGQPLGVVTAATAGITTASGTAITASELTRLAYSVDPAYRTGPKVGYMMKDDVIAYCLTLLDSTGRPLLRESFRDGGRELMLNGYPVWPNQFMTGLTAGAPVSAAKHVLFGDFSRIKTRDAGELRIRKLEERYAEHDQVGFVAFLRTDQKCVKSGALKYLLQA